MKIHVVEYKRHPIERRFRATANNGVGVLGHGSTADEAVKDLMQKTLESLTCADIEINFDTTNI